MDHQTFAQLLGNYGEFVGSIAVVVTLIYLTIQIRQNTNMMQAQTRNSITQNTMSIFPKDLHTAEIWVKGTAGEIEVGANAEWIFFQGLFQRTLKTWENEYYQYEQGLYEKELLSAHQHTWALALRARGNRMVWQSAREGYAPKFQRYIDQLIEDHDEFAPGQFLQPPQK